MRSMLYVPGNNRRFLEKAATLDIDVAIIDLEDSVPPAEKEAARPIAREAIDALAARRIEVFVRINSLATDLVKGDIRMTASPRLRGFMVPKIEGPEDLSRIEEILGPIEAKQNSARFEILPLIESAIAVVRAFDIARASPRVVALVFGAFDFTFDMRTNWSKEGTEYQFARQKLPVDARAAGVYAIDTVYPDLEDEDGFAKDVGLGKTLGYTGKTLIHPKQIGIVNSTFSPANTELDWAKRVINAYEPALRQGKGAISLDGKLVDMVHYRRAQEILALNDLILQRRRDRPQI